MTKLIGKRDFIAMLSLVTVGALSFGIVEASAGDDVSEDQIVQALMPKQRILTRGLSTGPQTSVPDVAPANPEEDKAIDSFRNRPTPSLSDSAREEIANIAQDKPNIDLT